MVKLSKRMKEANTVVEEGKAYSLQDALNLIDKFPKVKFDETVELHLRLNIDTKNTEQAVRGTVVLPHGTGKSIRIAAFCSGDQAQQAKDLGADYVGAQDLIEKVQNGFLDFDCVIATPDIMRDLSKLGRVLGPRGLMPSPKAGTVTADIAKAINEVKAGKIEFKADKQAGIHVGIGKRSFPKENLLANASQLLDAINQVKPTSVKGQLINSLALTTTMGPGIKVAV